MLFVLSIISALGITGTVIFAVSLRKYQNKYFEERIKARHDADQTRQLIKDRDDIIENDSHHVTDMEHKISAFDTEKEEIYSRAFAEGKKQSGGIDEAVLTERDSLITSLKAEQEEQKNKLANQNNHYEQIKFRNDELEKTLAESVALKKLAEQQAQKIAKLKNSGKFNINDIIENIDTFVELNQQIVAKDIDIKKAQFSEGSTIKTNILLEEIISCLELQIDKEYLASFNKEDADLLEYILIPISKTEVIFIDTKFSHFLISNFAQISNEINDEIKEKLTAIISSRSSFLANPENQVRMLAILKETPNMGDVEKISPSIYIASDYLLKILHNIDNDIFTDAIDSQIAILSPTALMHILSSSKNKILLEDNLMHLNIIKDSILEEYNKSEEESDDESDISGDLETSVSNNSSITEKIEE